MTQANETNSMTNNMELHISNAQKTYAINTNSGSSGSSSQNNNAVSSFALSYLSMTRLKTPNFAHTSKFYFCVDFFLFIYLWYFKNPQYMHKKYIVEINLINIINFISIFHLFRKVFT
jgi:hypothetical protein